MEQKMILATEDGSAAYVQSEVGRGTVSLGIESKACSLTGISLTPRNARQLIEALQGAIREVEEEKK